MAERKRFNEAIRDTLTEVAKQLLEEIPELDNLAFVITYAPDVGDPQPQCFAFSRSADPQLICRASLQTIKLLGVQINHIARDAQALLETMQQKEIDGNRPQAHETKGSTQTEDADPGDTPAGGSAEAPEDRSMGHADHR